MHMGYQPNEHQRNYKLRTNLSLKGKTAMKERFKRQRARTQQLQLEQADMRINTAATDWLCCSLMLHRKLLLQNAGRHGHGIIITQQAKVRANLSPARTSATKKKRNLFARLQHDRE